MPPLTPRALHRRHFPPDDGARLEQMVQVPGLRHDLPGTSDDGRSQDTNHRSKLTHHSLNPPCSWSGTPDNPGTRSDPELSTVLRPRRRRGQRECPASSHACQHWNPPDLTNPSIGNPALSRGSRVSSSGGSQPGAGDHVRKRSSGGAGGPRQGGDGQVTRMRTAAGQDEFRGGGFSGRPWVGRARIWSTTAASHFLGTETPALRRRHSRASSTRSVSHKFIRRLASRPTSRSRFVRQ